VLKNSVVVFDSIEWRWSCDCVRNHVVTLSTAPTKFQFYGRADCGGKVGGGGGGTLCCEVSGVRCLENTLCIGRGRKILSSDYLLHHVRPSVCPRGTTRLWLDGFL
jgi:hypothetical protein